MPRLVDLVKSGTFDDYIEEEKKARQNIVNVTMPKIPTSTGVQNKSTLSSSISSIGRGTAQQNGLSMIPKNNNESINTVKSGIKRALYGGNAAINGVIGTTANAIATPYNAVREVVAEQSTNSLLKNQIEKQKNLLSQIDYLRNYKHKNDEAGLIADPEYQQANKALESYTRVINAVRNNASSNVQDTPFTAAAKNTVAKRNESEQKALEGLGPVGQFLGSTAISGAESLITLPLAGPFGKSAYMGLQALSALGRKAYDVEAQGGSAKEALTRGTGSALVNYGTSGIGVDRLLGSAKHGMNSVLKNAVVQFPIEGSEEVLEYAGDYVVDKLMGDENAKFEPKEAFLNFLGGGLMGSAFGAGASKIGNYRNKSAADILKEQTLRNNSNLDTVEMPNISQIEKNNIIQRAYNMTSTDKNLLAQKLYNGNYASAKERLFDELTLKYAQGNKNGLNSLPVNGTKLPKMAVESDHNYSINSTEQNINGNNINNTTYSNLEDNNLTYTPSTKELISKSDAVITKINAKTSNEKLDTDSFNKLFKITRNMVKSMPWFNKPLVNNDTDFSSRYGVLRARVADSTLRKGRSYNTKYGVEQIAIMEHLNTLFENGKVINMKYNEKNNSGVKRIITLLSPIEFEDGRYGVVKLNVKEVNEAGYVNKIHENKILEISDYEIIEKKPPHLQRPRHTFKDMAKQSAETVSKMSVSDMLKFVKGSDEKYLPQDYFDDKTKVISDGDNKKEGLDALILNGLQLSESDTPSDPIFNYSINNTEGNINTSAEPIMSPIKGKGVIHKTTMADYSNFDENILQNPREARKKVLEYAKEKFPKTVIVRSNGMKVSIARNGLDKLLSGRITKDKYASSFYVPEIVKNAYNAKRSDYTNPYGKVKENIDGYTYLESDINIAGNPYKAYIRVRHSDNKNNYYGHTLGKVVDEIKIEPEQKSSSLINAASSVNAIEEKSSARADMKNMSSLSDGSNINYSIYNTEGNINTSAEPVMSPIKGEGVNNETLDKNDTRNIIVKLKESIPEISKMEPVSKLTGEEFPKGEKKLTEQVGDFFKKLGNKVTRKGFGDVIIDENGIKDSIAHGLGRAKSVTFAAVPDVIKLGKQIDYQSNWKNRGYDTYIFAAPVKIGNTYGNVGVIVRKVRGENKYYLHEVIDNNGNIIYIKKDSGNEPFKTQAVMANDGLLGDSNSLSNSINTNYSIYNTEGNYNGNSSQSFDKNTVIAPGDSFNNDSIGAASYNPNSVREQLDILAEANGAIPEGENAVRYANLPKSTDGETQVSRFARTLIETENTPDILVPELEKAVLDGKFSHIVSTDKKAIDNAVSTITKSGYDNTYNSWKVKVDNGQKITKEDIAIATQLYNEACTEAAKGDTKAAKIAMELASDMIAVQTNSGQVVQAASIMKKQTPTGKLYAMQKLVDTINKKGKNLKKVKGEKQNVVIESELAQKLLNAQNDTEAEVALDNIKDNIASQLNSTMAEALNQWRYTSMLANPKTHIRNLVGNAVTQELYTIKDIIGTAIESSVDKTGRAINGVGLESRTKAVLNRLNENDRKLIDFAKNDYKTDTKDILQSNNKYNEATDINSRKNVFATNPVARVLNKTPFAGKMLNVLENAVDKVAKTNSKLLDIEDNKFLESNYTRAFAQYMKANDFTPEYFKSFEGQQDYNKARQYAIRQAQEATFHDDNKVAAKLNELQRTNAAADFFIGTFLPFKKTPMNIVKRGVEYSPIGLAKGTKNLVKDVTVNKSVAQTMDALDEISKGLTGTGLMLLGAYAASKGIVNTMVGEDDRERALLQSQGEQDFAFRFNNKSYTIDSFAPAAIPFLTGAAVYESLSNDKDFTDFTIGDFTDAMTSMSEPMIQTSMLSSLNDMLTSLQYADNGGGKMLALGSSLAKNYAGQFIPTVFSATANTLDDTKRSTYIDKNSKLGNTLESIKQQMKYKTPGLHSDLEPYLDVWGQEDINNNVLERVFNNYLNPISVKDIENNTVNDEVLSLYKATGETSIMPRKPDKYTNVNNERVDFTAEQYTKFVKARNGETYKDISKLINMPEYANLSDEQRANIIEGLWDYNTIKAKEGLNIGYSSNDDKKIDTLKENGFTSAQAILFKQTLDNISAANGEKARAQKDYIQELDLSKKQKEALSEMYVSSSSVPAYTNGAGSANSEGYVLSQMNKSENKAWKILKERGMTLKELERANDVINKKGYSKEQKIAELQLMGYSNEYAHDIWDAFMKD